MAIEESVVARIEELIGEGSRLRQGNEYGQALSISTPKRVKDGLRLCRMS